MSGKWIASVYPFIMGEIGQDSYLTKKCPVSKVGNVVKKCVFLSENRLYPQVHFQRENDDKLGGLPSSRDSDRVPFLEGVKKRCGLEEMKKKSPADNVYVTEHPKMPGKRDKWSSWNLLHLYGQLPYTKNTMQLTKLLKHEPNRW